jgi:hypothetical protein
MFGLLLASCTALYLMQHEAWFKKSAEQKVKQFFSATYGATLVGDLDEINLFSPQIHLKNVQVKPLHGEEDWSWSTDTAHIHFSWLDVVRTGSIEVRVSLNRFKAYSDVDKTKLAVGEHLMKLFLPPDLGIPAVFKELQIKEGQLDLFEKNKKIRTELSLRVDTKKIGRSIKAGVHVKSGTVTGNETQWIANCAGKVELDLNDSVSGIKAKVSIVLDFDAPQLHQEPTCHVAGSWEYDHASFVLYNNNRSIVLDPITLDQSLNLVANLKAPVSYLQHFLPLTPDEQAEGTCTVNIRTNMKAPLDTMEAKVTAKNVLYKNIASNMVIEAKASEKGLQGVVAFDNAAALKLSGSWVWHRETGLDATIKNIKKIRLPNWWALKKNDLSAQIKVDPEGNFNASYRTKLTHDVSQATVICDGTVERNEELFCLKGKAGNDAYEVEIATDPFRLKRCTYSNKEGVLARCTSEAHKGYNNVEGTIDYALVYSWLPKELKKELIGSGVFKIKATQDEQGIAGTLSLADASIRIPRLYNFIGSLQANFSWQPDDRRILFNDIACRLHRGLVRSSQITVLLDEAYSIDFIHAPALIDSCFVSWQKDLFATISGNILFKYLKEGHDSLQGTIFVDRSQLKGNIFSPDLQQSMLLIPDTPLPTKTHDIMVDLKILTREPLRIKTSFVEAQAIFDMSIQKSISSPEVSGKVEILQGELKFPYKPLSIVSAVMYVLPQQMYDPLIELTARNKIKKYGVNLYVTGSVQNPHIHFEASPTLTEEQIIALLLTGAQDSSLNVIMPALIMNNIQQVIFGPAKSPSKLKGYFKNFLKPLSHVRIVPSFTDETGRGGLRAAIEIDVNDQLSAVIEKNFSLSEDVKFEIDYALSDDISLKGIQDERGDFGGEMEVKWKF